MKEAVYILFLTSTMFSSFAQNKIEGIGKFKIGKTTISVTEEIATEMGDKIIIIDEYLNRSIDHFRIGEIVVNETYPHRSLTEASFYPGVRTFHITTYKVAGITIDNLMLTFKNGILIGLNCLGSFDLAESLTLKHGQPKLKTELKKVMCAHAPDKDKLELEVTKYTQSWANGKILASAVLTKHYDQECMEKLADTFHVRDQAAYNAVVRYDATIRAKMATNRKTQLGIKRGSGVRNGHG